MKNKVIAVIAIIAVVCVSWLVVITSSSSREEQIVELKKQIEANKEVKTYKNTLPLYKELIKLEPEKVEWYSGLADTYMEIEQYGEYKKMCEQMITLFPDNKIGYLRIIKFYAETGKDNLVIQTYNEAPEAIKADKEFLEIYKKSEWKYRFVSRAYNSIGICAGGTYVIESNGVYGYKSKDLSSEIEPKFTVARPFIEDYAAVKKDNEWYFIDRVGDRVLATKEKLEDLHSLSGGFSVAKIGGKYGYIDSSFKKYSFEYQDATSFYNGVAAVKKNGKWGLINSNFEAITSFEYDDVVRDDANVCSRKGRIFMLKGKSYHMINVEGKAVTKDTFEDARLFYSDYTAVKKGGKWGFIDDAGKTAIEFKYDEAASFASGIATVKRGDQWGCVDKNGKVILEFDYQDARITADNGVVVLKVGKAYRFVKFIKFD